MKNKYTLITAFLLFGCSDEFLDVPLTDKLNQDILWSEEETAQAAVNGIYNQLTAGNLYSNPTVLEAITPNTYSPYDFLNTDNIARSSHNAGTLGIILGRWGDAYELIGRANTVLESIDKGPFSPEMINRFKGEALFLRALGYFNLWSVYGGVPLILDAPHIDQGLLPRNPMSEVIQQTIDDLETAADFLPESYSGADLGRVTKGAALALKSRVLLYRASPLFGGSNSQNEWQEAANVAKEVMDLGQYRLGDDYRELFRDENSQSRADEAIFQVFFQFPEVSSHGVDTRLELYNDFAPLPNLVNDYLMIDGKSIDNSALYDPNDPYANRDPRLKATIMVPGTMFNGREVITSRYPSTGFGLKKYTSFPDNEFIGEAGGSISDNDIMVLRYGEVLLNYAEAQNEATGPDRNVYEAINQTRERAGMPPVDEGLSKEEMREVIRHEKRIEFVGESLYYHDIRRWGTIEELMQNEIYDSDGALLSTRNFKPDRDYFWPIPSNIRELNPNLEQNPNY